MATAPEREGLAEFVAASFSEEVLPALGEFTRIRCLSPSFDPHWAEHGEIERAARLVEAFCKERRLASCEVEVVALEARTPVVLADVAATPGAEALGTTLIYGHLDKQPPLGSWRAGLDPFEAVREGDRLYGRGTADDGYAAFSALVALEVLERLGGVHGRVVVLVEASEESGSPDLAAHLDALADRIGPLELVVCLDSGALSYDRLWVTRSLRGNLIATLRVEVLDEAVHSGLAGGIVPSSFRIARELLSRVEDAATGDIVIDEFVTSVPEHRLAEIVAVVAQLGDAAAGVFPTVEGLELAGAGALERVLAGTWRASLAITGAEGLPDLEQAGNVLRPYTSLKLSLRLPPNANGAACAAALTSALTTDPPEGARVRLEITDLADGWDAPPTAPWLATALEQASLEFFGAPPRSMGLGGSIPFLAELGRRFPGAQVLATGVLGPESNAHGPNEFLHVPTAVALTASVARLLGAVPARRDGS